jgi:Acetyltransferase (GNAT) domain
LSGAAGGLRVERVERDRWCELAAGFADHNYRQVWDFGVHAANRVGAVSEHVALTDGTRVVGIADVRVRRLPALGGGIAYVTGGPLTRSDGAFDVSRFLSAAEALRREYAERRGLVLRIAPPVGPETWNRELSEGLAAAGFGPTGASSPYRTFLLPLDRPVAEIRRGFQQKWRNCLNRSDREGLTVLAGSDVEHLSRFSALFDEFVVRKGFTVNLGAEFYERVQRDAAPSERFVVLLAEREGVTIAGHVSSVLGDTSVYLLGATSPEALNRKAAYALQWRAIELAVERGCRWYDLGGIDPEGNPGVFHFKEGMSGADVTAAGPVEWHSGLRSRFVLALEARYQARRAAKAAQAGRC